MIVALMPDFEVLAGFRPVGELREILTELAGQPGELGEYATEWLAQVEDLKVLFGSMLMLGTRARPMIQQLLAVEPIAEATRDALAVARNVAQDFDSDPGVFITLLMNHVTLQPAEALAVPAGQLHAYLSGIGVEVMAESDNVLRGGLTKKHIDLPELEQVLVFESVEPQKVATEALAKGLTLYKTEFDDFLLYRIDLNGSTVLADLNLPGEGILLCTSGQLVVSNSLGETATLRRSEAAYLANDARLFTLSSSGTGYFVTAAK
jgi:mannose-6-phosphate isomerase